MYHPALVQIHNLREQRRVCVRVRVYPRHFSEKEWRHWRVKCIAPVRRDEGSDSSSLMCGNVRVLFLVEFPFQLHQS